MVMTYDKTIDGSGRFVVEGTNITVTEVLKRLAGAPKLEELCADLSLNTDAGREILRALSLAFDCPATEQELAAIYGNSNVPGPVDSPSGG